MRAMRNYMQVGALGCPACFLYINLYISEKSVPIVYDFS